MSLEWTHGVDWGYPRNETIFDVRPHSLRLNQIVAFPIRTAGGGIAGWHAGEVADRAGTGYYMKHSDGGGNYPLITKMMGLGNVGGITIQWPNEQGWNAIYSRYFRQEGSWPWARSLPDLEKQCIVLAQLWQRSTGEKIDTDGFGMTMEKIDLACAVL